jgi:hypothetical protein
MDAAPRKKASIWCFGPLICFDSVRRYLFCKNGFILTKVWNIVKAEVLLRAFPTGDAFRMFK